MNLVIKTLVLTILTVSALYIWLACGVVGTLLSFTDVAYVSSITPFIGLIGVICIINCGIRFVRSNPSEWIGNLFGEKKI